MVVTREFAADLDLVWDAWTKAEMLDQWMGPRPWRVQTKEMDFREGGRWLYAMISPENVFTYSKTTNSFKAGADKTTVQIVKKMASLAELEQFIAGGYYEKGMDMVMHNLDEYLFSLVANK